MQIFDALLNDEARLAEVEYWSVRCVSGQLLLHKKGGLYKFIKFVKSTEDGSIMAFYDHLWPHEYGSWVRPYEEFVDGRFVEVSLDGCYRDLGPNYFNLKKE